MEKLRAITVKAFTKNPELGNPAIVIDAPLDSEEAMNLVREAQCAVAAIIDTRQNPIPIRFLYENGATETFACGHATLAAAHIAFPPQEQPVHGEFVNTKGTTIEVTRFPDGKISQTQSVPEFRDLEIPKEELSEALHIDRILDDLPIQLVGAPGKMKLMIPVTLENLLKIQRDFTSIRALCTRYSTEADPITGLFPFTVDAEKLDAHARHFPNRDEEDLVCGVGSVALAEYLQKHLRPNQQEFLLRCGPGLEGVGDLVVRMEVSGNSKKIYLEGYAVSA
ncbi:MAG: PhzF family phenazine biosynthesis protein [Patescibacteria group bacterium]